MEHTIHDRTAGRNEAAADTGHDPAVTRDRAGAGPGTIDAQLMGETYEDYRKRVSGASVIAGPARQDLANALRPATHYAGAIDEPVLICAWCPALHILRMERREQDVIVIYQQGKELRILRNGVQQKISQGICVPCRERMKR